METTLNEEEKSLIKARLKVEANILTLALYKWTNKLKEFEEEYNMSSKTFINKFNKGELGDEKKWFEWLFAYKAHNHIKSKLDLIKNINL